MIEVEPLIFDLRILFNKTMNFNLNFNIPKKKKKNFIPSLSTKLITFRQMERQSKTFHSQILRAVETILQLSVSSYGPEGRYYFLGLFMIFYCLVNELLMSMKEKLNKRFIKLPIYTYFHKLKFILGVFH